ncbi:hypothetical protein [Pseudorhodobacter sp.]|uniref:hypothetical protein n=1 Tax=Pseudorhodobacter sp. TaxID=1934400 RepID=UPI002AFE06CE|nr:hypothetical protein [Pseudorhodobacter sp.]
MKRPLFLPPQGYRQRRLRDVARLLPVMALFLIFLPMLWGEETSDLRQTGSDGIYLFLVWLFLIVAAAIIARRLSDEADAVKPAPPPPVKGPR